MRGLSIKPRVRVIADHRIDTDRLLLRSPVADDAGEISRLMGSWDVAHWLVRVPFPYRVEHARAWIERSVQERNAGIGWPFVIFRRDDGALVGSIDLSVETDRKSAALGYWLGERQWGQGFASEAARAMIRFAFTNLKLRQVTANALPENARSIRVLEKIGLRYVEMRPEDTVERGRIDTAFFALDHAHWSDGE
jgi:8-oxo-dGTP diphosphatase